MLYPSDFKVKTMEVGYIILKKTQELARFLLGKSACLDFVNPLTDFKRTDGTKLRNRISELSAKRIYELGICQNTLHDMRRHVRNGNSFRRLS